MKNFISVFIILLFVQDIRAQNFELGGEFGVGATIMGGIDELYTLFGQYADNNLKIGFLASMNPNKTILHINSGILMQWKGNNSGYLENFKIPLGIDAFFGRKVAFIIGAGLYLNYFFSTCGRVSYMVTKTKKDLQFGSYADMGLKFKINNYLNMLLKIQMDYDLTPFYKDAHYYHAGQLIDSYYNVRSMEYTVNLGFMYRLHNRATKK